jgi:hypothetical protein
VRVRRNVWKILDFFEFLDFMKLDFGLNFFFANFHA